MDTANRNARAAELGLLQRGRRVRRHRVQANNRLRALTQQLNERQRTLASFLEAAKHLYRHRVAAVNPEEEVTQ